MKLRYIYIIVLCILTSGCNYLDIMPDERAKLEVVWWLPILLTLRPKPKDFSIRVILICR